MLLINARPSPYGRKVAITLREKAIAYEVQYEVPWGDETCTPDHSPLEQLPILILDGGETVFDSSYILDWLELRYPEPPLLPADRDGIAAARLLKMLGERVMEIAHTLIFEMVRPEPSAPWVDRQTRKVRGGFAELDRLVGARRPGTTQAITLGDIAVGSTVGVFEFAIREGLVPDINVLRWRDRHANLSGFLDALERRPSFEATRPAMMDVDLQAVLA